MLALENLSLGYPGRQLCRDLSLTIQPGECWAILGQNGSGKTTLLHTLAGLKQPLGGSVRWQGEDVHQLGRRALASQIGVLLQEEEAGYCGSVRDYVSLGRFPHGGMGQQVVAAALRQMELQLLASRLMHTLSGGERQRARMALLLAQAPVLYCLDEPLLHLDLRHQAQVMQCLWQLARRQGKGIVMVLHEPYWASRYCDHVLLLYDNGSTLSGPTADVLTHENLERLYQCALDELHAGQQLYVTKDKDAI